MFPTFGGILQRGYFMHRDSGRLCLDVHVPWMDAHNPVPCPNRTNSSVSRTSRTIVSRIGSKQPGKIVCCSPPQLRLEISNVPRMQGHSKTDRYKVLSAGIINTLAQQRIRVGRFTPVPSRGHSTTTPQRYWPWRSLCIHLCDGRQRPENISAFRAF